MPSKSDFLAAYRAALAAAYPWAQDEAQLDRFLASVRDTLTGPCASWHPEGAAVNAAWRAIGRKGVPSLKSLRALEG